MKTKLGNVMPLEGYKIFGDKETKQQRLIRESEFGGDLTYDQVQEVLKIKNLVIKKMNSVNDIIPSIMDQVFYRTLDNSYSNLNDAFVLFVKEGYCFEDMRLYCKYILGKDLLGPKKPVIQKNTGGECQVGTLIKTIMIENEIKYNDQSIRELYLADIRNLSPRQLHYGFDYINNLRPTEYAKKYLKDNELFSVVFELIDFINTPHKKNKNLFFDKIQKRINP